MHAQRVMIAVCALTLGAMAVSGCENEQARQRAELQQAVEQANADLREATLVMVDPDSPDQFEQTRSKLEGVVRTLKSARADGDTGQEPAINLLLADASRQLATMRLAEVGDLQQSVRDAQAMVRSQVSALQRLNEFTTAVGSIDTSQESGQLEEARMSASAQLEQLSQQLAQLDQPIAELSKENRDDAQRIRALREEAQNLLRRASEEGPADGFSAYQAAVQKQRNADEIEAQVAKRELDLAYEYEPQHKRTGSQAQNMQKFISALEQARENLQEITSTISGEVSKTRERMTTLRDSVKQRMNKLEETIAGPFEQYYQEGLQSADEALRAVQKAARDLSGADRNSAKLLEAQILETKARLHWAKARVLEDRIALLQRLSDAGDVLDNASTYRNTLDEARKAYNQAIEMATEAYTTAQASVPSGNSPQLSALKRSLEMALGALQGQDLEEIEYSTPAGNGAGPATGSGSTGYPTPQALLAALQSMSPDDPTSALVMLNAVHTQSNLQRQYIEASKSFVNAASELEQASKAAFGDQAQQGQMPGGQMSSNFPDFANAEIVQNADDSATVQIPSGDVTSIDLVRVDGQWKIDFDALISAMDDGSMSLADTTQMMQAMAASFRELAGRVRSGEISTPQQLMQEMFGGLGEQMNDAMNDAAKDMGEQP